MVSQAKQVPWRAVTVAPVILLFGSQQFFADRAVKIIREKLGNSEGLEVVEVDASDYSAGSIFDLASSGLFGESKLVIINDVQRCTDALITDGIEYLANPSAESVVIFRHDGKSVRGKRLLEAIRANESCLEGICLDISKEAEKIAFIEAEFTSKGRKIQRQAAVAISQIFGKDFEEIAAACSQLQLDDAGEITAEIVEKYFGGRLETTVFVIADAAIAGQVSEALLRLRHGLAQGLEPVMLLGAIARKINQFVKVRGNPNISAQSLGVVDWVLGKIRQEAASWSEDSLALVIEELAETDFAIKGGQKDPQYALEKLIRLVANKGRPIG
ncbi:MAG: DNA polymerase III subunit delta [Micrococcales bacterium]|nr:DNA polymerase III subunit delta [Micrococcales bacterium]